jgi:lipopolysaccharide export system protein LptA
MSKHQLTTWRWFAAALAAVALVFAVTAPAPTQAQGLTNNFGGLGQNSGEPIDIESDVLVVHDSKKYATFKGNVKAVQGKTTLIANELDVHYTGSGADSLSKGTDATATASNDAAPATTTDARTGESRFENQGDTATKGRIRALFVPKQDAKSGESKSDGQAGDGASSGKKASGDKPAAAAPAAAAPAQDGAPMPLMPPPQ